MPGRDNTKHQHPRKAMIIIHDGVCGNPFSYGCTESGELARIFAPLSVRLGLLDVCECGCPIWGMTVDRDKVRSLIATIGEELAHAGFTVEEDETDAEWHEELVDHLRNCSGSRN